MSSNILEIASGSGGDESHMRVHEEEESLVNVVLDGQFRIEKLLRHENHADVYSIRSLRLLSECFEARAYELEGLSWKLRRHRLRNIKRLSNRTVLEARWRRKTVVIYKVGSETHEDRKDGNNKEILPVYEESDLIMSNTKTRQKTESTNHQREMARIRQLERRRLKRRNKQRMKVTGGPEGDSPEADKTVAEARREADEEDALYILLHIASSDRPKLREQLPPASRAVLEQYLEKRNLTFQNEDELEAFMNTKYREVLFLRRQEMKLPQVISRRHNEFDHILREQASHPRLSKEYKELQPSVSIAHHRLRVVQNVRDILPKVIEDADRVSRDLRRRLSLARRKKEEMSVLAIVNAERESMKRQVTFYKRCSQAVVPASGPYFQMVAQFVAAEKDLKMFDAKHSESLMLSFESLEAEYMNLLGGDGEDPRLSTQALVHGLI